MRRTRLVLLLVFGMLAALLPAGAVGAADGVCHDPYTPIYEIQGDGFTSPLLPSALQFLSYEGSFTANGGPADGMVSVDIGFSETSSTSVGHSLQLIGNGSSYGDFSWSGAAPNTFGAVNTGQTFSGSGDMPFINEIHYDNAGTDAGEAIEIAGPAGFDLSGWSIVLYNGSNGSTYNTTTLAGVIPNDGSGFGVVVVTYPVNGIQNGSPDGLALVTPDDGPITTQGVVTADFQKSSELSGFFVQDVEGDDDLSTSDGVFVYHRDTWAYDVSVGDVVRFTAEVEERFGLTRLNWVDDLTVCGKDNPKSIKVELPLDNSGREAIEGMLVRFEEKLFVTDTYNLHSYGEAWLTQDGVAEQPTNEFEGGSAAMDALAASNMEHSILLDDGSGDTPDPVPYTHHNGTLRLGDFVKHLEAVVSYDFGQYRLMPTEVVNFKPLNQRPNEPHAKGNVVVGSANVLNYWTTLGGRGAETPEQLAVQTEKLVAELRGLGADVIGLQEVENDPTHLPILTLVAAMNAAEGSDVWAWMGEPTNQEGDVYYNSYSIRNEIIYRLDRVTPIFESPLTIEDDAFDWVPPGRTDPVGRPPVAQAFEANGEVFSLIVNHLKSKSCSGASGADMDQGDGQSCFNARRVLQAETVLDFVETVQGLAGDDDVLVVGDMNSYLAEDPIVEFESELVNLVSEHDEDPYSYTFFATYAFPYVGRGLLDHAFATGSMASQVRSTDVWHINADEPRLLDWYDVGTVAPGPYRASDHDPVAIGLRLGNGDIK